MLVSLLETQFFNNFIDIYFSNFTENKIVTLLYIYQHVSVNYIKLLALNPMIKSPPHTQQTTGDAVMFIASRLH